jgi:hypothetical protein
MWLDMVMKAGRAQTLRSLIAIGAAERVVSLLSRCAASRMAVAASAREEQCCCCCSLPLLADTAFIRPLDRSLAALVLVTCYQPVSAQSHSYHPFKRAEAPASISLPGPAAAPESSTSLCHL